MKVQDYVHTGPGTLAGRYMRQFWHPVAELSGLKPGTVRRLKILGEDLTLYRGESGAVHLVAFRCAHRGAQLSLGRVRGDTIQCRYHGWRYEGDGRCVDQPAEGEAAFCDKVKIASRPVRVYGGLVFAWLGGDPVAEFPTYPAIEGEGVIETASYIRRCNYFNNIDNQLDEAHVNFVHLDAFARIPELPHIDIRETEYGALSSCPRPSGGVRVTHFLMPNVTQLKSPSADPEIDWTEYLVWRVPIDDESHYTFGINYINVKGEAKQRYLERRAGVVEAPPPPIEDIAESIVRGEMTLDEATQKHADWDILYRVYLEDHVIQVGQGRVADRGAEILGRSDVGVRALRKLWNEELTLLAEGRPTRKWTRPAVLETTSGE